MFPIAERVERHNFTCFPTLANLDVITARLERLLSTGRRVTSITYLDDAGAGDFRLEPSLTPLRAADGGFVERITTDAGSWLLLSFSEDVRVPVFASNDTEEQAAAVEAFGGPGVMLRIAGFGDGRRDRITVTTRVRKGYPASVQVLHFEDPVQGWDAPFRS